MKECASLTDDEMRLIILCKKDVLFKIPFTRCLTFFNKKNIIKLQSLSSGAALMSNGDK